MTPLFEPKFLLSKGHEVDNLAFLFLFFGGPGPRCCGEWEREGERRVQGARRGSETGRLETGRALALLTPISKERSGLGVGRVVEGGQRYLFQQLLEVLGADAASAAQNLGAKR